MAPGLKKALSFETDWLHGYARTYLPCESSFAFSADDLRASGTTLVDLRNLFSYGTVVYSDKLDGPGALWIVSGDDGDGHRLQAAISVISEELRVTLISVNWEEERQNDPYDAA